MTRFRESMLQAGIVSVHVASKVYKRGGVNLFARRRITIWRLLFRT